MSGEKVVCKMRKNANRKQNNAVWFGKAEVDTTGFVPAMNGGVML